MRIDKLKELSPLIIETITTIFINKTNIPVTITGVEHLPSNDKGLTRLTVWGEISGERFGLALEVTDEVLDDLDTYREPFENSVNEAGMVLVESYDNYLDKQCIKKEVK